MTNNSTPQNNIEVFLRRTEKILGLSRNEIKRLLQNHSFKAFRLNTMLQTGDHQDYVQKLSSELGITVRKLKWYKDAYIFDAEDTAKIQQSSFATEGHIYIQNPSSFIPVFALDPQPEDSILDMCSAPGGKASHIVSLTQNPSNLTANEPKVDRALRLREVLSLQGCKEVEVTQYDGETIAQSLNKQFNKVLIDAECSTEAGTNFLSRNPLSGWSENYIARLSKLQKSLIINGYDLLMPGGTLIYATCTFAPEENEEVVSHLLTDRPEAIIQPLAFHSEPVARKITTWRGELYPENVAKGVLRILPGDYMEGFFVARIRKPHSDESLNNNLADTFTIIKPQNT